MRPRRVLTSVLVFALLTGAFIVADASAKPPAEPVVRYAIDDGHLDAGLLVTGLDAGDAGVRNVARVPFEADDCHRHLRVRVDYAPANASADAGIAHVAVPFELRLRLVDADTGAPVATHRILTPGTYGHDLTDPGPLVAELWLVRGADVAYTLRVDGWRDPDAECRWQGRAFANEVQLAGPDGEQWVEVLNDGFEPLDLANWTLTPVDDPAATAHAVPAVVVPVGGHVVIPLPEGFLDPEGDGVRLLAARGWEVDRTPRSRDDAGDARSWQRTPDGADAWAFREATPGAPNGPADE